MTLDEKRQAVTIYGMDLMLNLLEDIPMSERQEMEETLDILRRLPNQAFMAEWPGMLAQGEPFTLFEKWARLDRPVLEKMLETLGVDPLVVH